MRIIQIGKKFVNIGNLSWAEILSGESDKIRMCFPGDVLPLEGEDARSMISALMALSSWSREGGDAVHGIPLNPNTGQPRGRVVTHGE